MSQAYAQARWRTTILGAALVTLTWLTFGQTLGHEFINYDDNAYVYQNPVVVRGLTLDGIAWAFTHLHSGNWHPLTSISHMLDCQFYGLNPEAIILPMFSCTASLCCFSLLSYTG